MNRPIRHQGEGGPRAEGLSALTTDPGGFFRSIRWALANTDSDVVYLGDQPEAEELDAFGTLSAISPPEIEGDLSKAISALEEDHKGSIYLNGEKSACLKTVLEALRKQRTTRISKLIQYFSRLTLPQFAEKIGSNPELRQQTLSLKSKLRQRESLTDEEEIMVVQIMMALKLPHCQEHLQKLKACNDSIRILERLEKQELTKNTRTGVKNQIRKAQPTDLWGDPIPEGEEGTDPFGESRHDFSLMEKPERRQNDRRQNDRRQGRPDTRPRNKRVERRQGDRRQRERRKISTKPVEMELPAKRVFLIPAKARNLCETAQSAVEREKRLDDGSLLIRVLPGTRLYYDANRRLYVQAPGSSQAARLPRGTNIGR